VKIILGDSVPGDDAHLGVHASYHFDHRKFSSCEKRKNKGKVVAVKDA